MQQDAAVGLVPHTAEGELSRAVFAEACDAHGVEAVRSESKDVREQLKDRLGPKAVTAFLAAGRQAVGTPWNREIQDAALAARGLLGH